MGLNKILLVTSNLGGGTGAHLAHLVALIDRSAWHMELVCFGTKDEEPPAHVPVREVPSFGRLNRFPIAQWREFRELRCILDREKPDIVHTYFIWPIIYGRLLKRIGRIRHLVENREDEGFNLAPWERWFLRVTSHVPDRVICVSEAVRGVVLEQEGVSEERVLVIHNGIVPPNRAGADVNAAVVRRDLGLSEEHLVVGMVANLNRPVKGGRFLIEAIPMVAAALPQVRFLLLGGGAERSGLEARTEELGIRDKVIFAGFRTDIHRYYPIIDASVLTSLSEGLSITLLESMSFGIPVVATAVGGNPEIVRHGETGFLVPPRDPEAFAACVVELLANPELRAVMGRAGRSVVERDFDLRDTARAYQAVYSEVLSGGRSTALA